MVHNKRTIYVLGWLFLLAYGCAVRQAPSGGPKDETPPKLLTALPDTFTTNFNSKTIALTFDEYFQLNEFSGRFVASPPLEQLPTYKIKGKTLLLDLGENVLKPNTTYNFNFGNSIADINENKALDNFSFVFSTGAFIDSLKQSGQVLNAFTNAPEKGVTVMLYPADGFTDSIPYKNKPLYFAKTNDNGLFSLDYLSAGSYKLIAVKESNNNYIIDSEAEQVAFVDSLVVLGKSTLAPLRLFAPLRKKQRLIKNTYTAPGLITLVYNKPPQNLRLLNMANPTDSGFYIPQPTGKADSLQFWIKGRTKPDTLKLITYDGETPLDTIQFNPNKTQRGFGGKPNAKVAPDTTLKISLTNISKGKLALGADGILLTLSHPAERFDLSKIAVYNLTDTLTNPWFFTDSTRRTLRFSYPFADETPYKFSIAKGCFTDIFGFANDTVNASFTLAPERDYGGLVLNVLLPDSNTIPYIFDMLDGQGKSIKTLTIIKPQKINFGFLPPGTYNARLIEDRNNNTLWDTGNYPNLQPENVLYGEKITIRAGWDQTLDWNLTRRGVK